MTLTVEQIVSADGYAAAPDGDLSFFDTVEFGDQSRTDSEQLQWLQGVDAILLGANTYRMFSQYWPTADPAVDAVAEPIARLPKFVISNGLDAAPWGNGELEILRGDGIDSTRALKRRFGSIVVWGSLQLADALLAAGEVDVLRLRVVPVLIGEGLGFTPNGLGRRNLRLTSVVQHPTGHIGVTYAVG